MTVKVYKGHNSPFLVEILNVEGNLYTAEQMATITRCYLKYISDVGGTAEYADSAVHTTVFDWDTHADDGKLLVDIGLLDFTVGRDRTTELIIYDEEYTEGRVVTQLDLQISDEAEGDIAGADVLSIITSSGEGGSGRLSPLNKTDNYTCLVTDFNRTVRLNAESAKTFILPEATADNDGDIIDFACLGIGTLTLQCPSNYYVWTPTENRMSNATQYAFVSLEYVHSKKLYIRRASNGTWTGA